MKRVTTNKGNKTPGVDKIIWSTPKSKTDAITQVTQRGYQPLALRRIYIAKKNPKEETLGNSPNG
ncbi:reverse transcriptase N-terminal domain-containing protein [Acidithrix ferrooxidans]|uniref:reverse transcriptase N-terminal domain-containing protein n=1 Tax=Acidithrix ferrooxidans TaxID=1280514 RepID=UPI001F15C105